MFRKISIALRVSIASSSANTFRQLENPRRTDPLAESQSLLHQRILSGGRFRPESTLKATLVAVSIASSSANTFRLPSWLDRCLLSIQVSIASSSANTFRHKHGIRCVENLLRLNRFFISEYFPAAAPMARRGAHCAVSIASSSANTFRLFSRAGTWRAVAAVSNRFFISEYFPASFTRFNRVFPTTSLNPRGAPARLPVPATCGNAPACTERYAP